MSLFKSLRRIRDHHLRVLCFVGVLFGFATGYLSQVYALSVGTKLIKPKAFFTEAPGGLYEPLDLKKKTFVFNGKDAQNCRDRMRRNPKTLTFSCTLELDNYMSARLSRLKEQSSPASVNVQIGSRSKVVRIEVSSDARIVTFTMDLDSDGVDFDWLKMNDDLAPALQHYAETFITEALLRNRLVLLVLQG